MKGVTLTTRLSEGGAVVDDAGLDGGGGGGVCTLPWAECSLRKLAGKWRSSMTRWKVTFRRMSVAVHWRR